MNNLKLPFFLGVIRFFSVSVAPYLAALLIVMVFSDGSLAFAKIIFLIPCIVAISLSFIIYYLRDNWVFSKHSAAIEKCFLPKSVLKKTLLWFSISLFNQLILIYSRLIQPDVPNWLTHSVFGGFVLFLLFKSFLETKNEDEFDLQKDLEKSRLGRNINFAICIFGFIFVAAIGFKWGQYENLRPIFAFGFLIAVATNLISSLLADYAIDRKYRILPQNEYE